MPSPSTFVLGLIFISILGGLYYETRNEQY